MINRTTLGVMLVLCTGSILESADYPPDGWRMPMVIVDQPDQQKFSEIHVKGDTIHIIWVDNRDGTYRLYYKRSTDAGIYLGRR